MRRRDVIAIGVRVGLQSNDRPTSSTPSLRQTDIMLSIMFAQCVNVSSLRLA
jgi:hypothetical protein